MFDAFVAHECNTFDNCVCLPTLCEFVVVDKCEEIVLSVPDAESLASDFWFVVLPDFSEIIDCTQPAGGPPDEVGHRYTLRIDCFPFAAPCPWDFDGDGAVGFADLLKLLSNWGPCPGSP